MKHISEVMKDVIAAARKAKELRDRGIDPETGKPIDSPRRPGGQGSSLSSRRRLIRQLAADSPSLADLGVSPEILAIAREILDGHVPDGIEPDVLEALVRSVIHISRHEVE